MRVVEESQNQFYRAVAQRIAGLREDRGLTQEALAKRASLNKFYVARVEAGAENLSLQTLSRLALALEVAPSAFLDGLAADPSVLEMRPRRNARVSGASAPMNP